MATIKTPIPSKIRIGRRQYSVELLETMPQKRTMGRISYTAQTIKLGQRSNLTKKKYSPESVQETFWHEITHGILYDMGRDTLNRDERFVAGFAHRLSKAIKSASF
jgi:hypothetical protein